MIISRSRFPVALCALGMALIALMALAISVGSFPVPLAKVVAVLWAVLTGGDAQVADNMRAVVLQVRAPRVIAALAVGAALASAGAAYQNLFRNPLVSPDILGVSAGCALGAVTGENLSKLYGLPVGVARVEGAGYRAFATWPAARSRP